MRKKKYSVWQKLLWNNILKTGHLLFLFCLLTHALILQAQQHILGKDSLQLTFFPISGIENYHSNSDCEITGSIWVDSLSVKIKLLVKDDDLILDKPYEKGDHVELIFAIPELKDSENVYINLGKGLYQFKNTNDLK